MAQCSHSWDELYTSNETTNDAGFDWPPEFKSAPPKSDQDPKSQVILVFQPPFFRGKPLNFRGVAEIMIAIGSMIDPCVITCHYNEWIHIDFQPKLRGYTCEAFKASAQNSHLNQHIGKLFLLDGNTLRYSNIYKSPWNRSSNTSLRMHIISAHHLWWPLAMGSLKHWRLSTRRCCSSWAVAIGLQSRHWWWNVEAVGEVLESIHSPT